MAQSASLVTGVRCGDVCNPVYVRFLQERGVVLVYETSFFDGVIVRRAQGREAVARGEKVEGIGSPLTKVQRRVLAAQLRAQGKAVTRKGGSWTKNVNDAAVLGNLDPTLIAVAKAEAKVRRAQVSLMGAVAEAQAKLSI